MGRTLTIEVEKANLGKEALGLQIEELWKYLAFKIWVIKEEV